MDYCKLSESELCELLKAGDDKAYSEIYRRYAANLRIHASRRCGNNEDANDLLQEVFAMLWEKRETLDINSSINGFLASCISNLFLSKLKHIKVRDKYLNQILYFENNFSYPTDTDHLIRMKQLEEKISKEINNLPPKMREMFIMSRYGNMSHQKIAEELGKSEKTVSRQISNSLKILRLKLPYFAFLLLLNIKK